MDCGFNTFELDDHPLDWEYTIQSLKQFRRRNKNFKANLFCVPSLMSYRQIVKLKRHDWIRMYPHGFRHKRKECIDLTDEKLRWLDELRASSTWGNVFKAPRYGYSDSFLLALQERGFVVALNTLNLIDQLPNMRSWNRRNYEMLSEDNYQHILRHCRYPDKRAFGRPVRSGGFTSLSVRFNRGYKRWLRSTDKPFSFCEDLATNAQIKINIGCGRHFLPSWMNLDHRPASPDVQAWVFPDPIPCIANRAEIVHTSHFLNYVEDFEQLFLDIWRVLRPGGTYRLEEDDQDSGYKWRRIGQRHATGRIRAEPTKRAVFDTLERVGFTVREVRHDETATPHMDVLALHTRHKRWERKQKFVAEAVKDISIKNLTRAYLSDPRAPRRGEYPYSLKKMKGFES
jgi:hypothetical protein